MYAYLMAVMRTERDYGLKNLENAGPTFSRYVPQFLTKFIIILLEHEHAMFPLEMAFFIISKLFKYSHSPLKD